MQLVLIMAVSIALVACTIIMVEGQGNDIKQGNRPLPDLPDIGWVNVDTTSDKNADDDADKSHDSSELDY
jgi:hypothetical protein